MAAGPLGGAEWQGPSIPRISFPRPRTATRSPNLLGFASALVLSFLLWVAPKPASSVTSLCLPRHPRWAPQNSLGQARLHSPPASTKWTLNVPHATAVLLSRGRPSSNTLASAYRPGSLSLPLPRLAQTWKHPILPFSEAAVGCPLRPRGRLWAGGLVLALVSRTDSGVWFSPVLQFPCL